MPCAVKSSFKTDLQISLQRSIIQIPISLQTKTCFHASNRRYLLSEFELCWHPTSAFQMHHCTVSYNASGGVYRILAILEKYSTVAQHSNTLFYILQRSNLYVCLSVKRRCPQSKYSQTYSFYLSIKQCFSSLTSTFSLSYGPSANMVISGFEICRPSFLRTSLKLHHIRKNIIFHYKYIQA